MDKSDGPTSERTRQPVRNADATRASILDAAADEFAINGLAGARTEAIAENTGVTKAMIYYYFNSKEQLYEAVLERAFRERLQSVQNIASQALSAEDALKQFVLDFMNGARNKPNWPNIIMYEAMQNKGKYYSKIGMVSIYNLLAGLIDRGIAEGAFRKVDALHAAVNIIGACTFYFCARENLKNLWPERTMTSDEMVREHLEGALDLILSGIRVLQASTLS